MRLVDAESGAGAAYRVKGVQYEGKDGAVEEGAESDFIAGLLVLESAPVAAGLNQMAENG